MARALDRQGPQPKDETEHFIKCPCGHMIDCRDLGDVLEHMGHVDGEVDSKREG